MTDRHFCRQKYDAAKTLDAFQATLSEVTDLEQLRAQVLAVVNETMQPDRVSLWLRQLERHDIQPAHLDELTGLP